jgi:hypothetical protein
MPESTRLAIVQQALADIQERLAEMPLTPRVLDLREKAASQERAVRSWEARPPTDSVLAATLKAVLELHVSVMETGKSLAPP